MSSGAEPSSSSNVVGRNDFVSDATNLRSAATIIGGVALVLLLAPQSVRAALVVMVAVAVGAINYRHELVRRLADVSAAARPRRISLSGLFDFLDGLELVAIGVVGTAVFVALNLFIWRWVEQQGSTGFVFLYLVLLGLVILSLIRDFALLRFGPVTGLLGASWLCCVLWVGFQLWQSG